MQTTTNLHVGAKFKHATFHPLLTTHLTQVHSLICYMLDEMQVAGWDVQTATDLSRCKDLSTFFLKRRTKAMTDRDDPVRARRNVNNWDHGRTHESNKHVWR